MTAMPGKPKSKLQKTKSERVMRVNRGKTTTVVGPIKQRRNSNTTPYNTRRRKSSCPEILIHTRDLQSKNIHDLVKLVKMGEADLISLALMGIFPLHEAVAKGLTEYVTLLIESDSNLNLRTAEGKTALDVAVTSGNFECAELLIKNGASVEKIRDGIRPN